MNYKKRLELENYNLRRIVEDFKFYALFLNDELKKTSSNKNKVEIIKINLKYLKDIIERETK